MTLPNALPEPTAPQDGEQMPSQKTFNIAAAKEFDRAEDLLAAMLSQKVDANGFVYAAFGPKAQEMLRDALSRLSSLSTELVQVRGALEDAKGCIEDVMATGVANKMATRATYRTVCKALGGLVPPDASPRRTE